VKKKGCTFLRWISGNQTIFPNFYRFDDLLYLYKYVYYLK